MAAEPRIDYKLFLVFGLCEFKEEDAGGEVIDVRHAEGE